MQENIIRLQGQALYLWPVSYSKNVNDLNSNNLSSFYNYVHAYTIPKSNYLSERIVLDLIFRSVFLFGSGSLTKVQYPKCAYNPYYIVNLIRFGMVFRNRSLFLCLHKRYCIYTCM